MCQLECTRLCSRFQISALVQKTFPTHWLKILPPPSGYIQEKYFFKRKIIHVATQGFAPQQFCYCLQNDGFETFTHVRFRFTRMPGSVSVIPDFSTFGAPTSERKTSELIGAPRKSAKIGRNRTGTVHVCVVNLLQSF